jgi:hypothetical protein
MQKPFIFVHKRLRAVAQNPAARRDGGGSLDWPVKYMASSVQITGLKVLFDRLRCWFLAARDCAGGGSWSAQLNGGEPVEPQWGR